MPSRKQTLLLPPPIRFQELCPIVRYVDEERAIVDLRVTIAHNLLEPSYQSGKSNSHHLELMITIHGPDNFSDEHRTTFAPSQSYDHLQTRFEIVRPLRWWPAGMGDQPLYDLEVSIVIDHHTTDTRRLCLGLTSVRSATENHPDPNSPCFIVNGQPHLYRQIIPVDLITQHQLLPVAGNTILLVRDHYGPDLLYNAADRAGLLLIQSIPIHPQAKPETDVPREIARLTTHPSLAGWFIGHLGQITQSVADSLRLFDPTHHIFRKLPGIG